jgi:uncharacterized protein
MNNILITGASGLVGTHLTKLLTERGHRVTHLGRSKKANIIPSFVWDVTKGTIEPKTFENIDTVIHLAGAGIADKRWTANRKQEILESRTKSTALLAKYVNANPHVRTVVSASAIGYYGFNESAAPLTESSAVGTDFLAAVVQAWEAEADKITDSRVVKIRTGIVLSKTDGALPEIAKPVRWGVGAPLGSGNQYVSWIHIDDLCRMFVKAVEDDSMHGAYNATAPHPVTNRELTKAIAQTLHKPLWLPAVPGFALKLALGEMANLVLYGSNVLPTRFQKDGFAFKFETLDKALQDLL